MSDRVDGSNGIEMEENGPKMHLELVDRRVGQHISRKHQVFILSAEMSETFQS